AKRMNFKVSAVVMLASRVVGRRRRLQVRSQWAVARPSRKLARHERARKLGPGDGVHLPLSRDRRGGTESGAPHSVRTAGARGRVAGGDLGQGIRLRVGG